MPTSPQIGDSQAVARNAVVASLPISVVTQAELEDATSAVNDTLISGKKYGSTYLVALTAGGFDIAVATGVDTTSDWATVGALATITPE